jgi:hypothetical protein
MALEKTENYCRFWKMKKFPENVVVIDSAYDYFST